MNYLFDMGVDSCGDNGMADATIIYQAYPKKVARPMALKAIQKAIKKHGLAFVLEKTRQYATARANCDPAFTPHPATWFNQERYMDDPKTWVNGKMPEHSRWVGDDRSQAGEVDNVPIR